MAKIDVPFVIGDTVYVTQPNYFGDIEIQEAKIVKVVQKEENGQLKNYFSTNLSNIEISEKSINKTVFVSKLDAEKYCKR